MRSGGGTARRGQHPHGLLADPNGLDVDELLALRERNGDRLVEYGPRPVRPREALFELDCDVLVPGARPDSITPDLAERVRCAVVAPRGKHPLRPGRGRSPAQARHSRRSGLPLELGRRPPIRQIGQDEEPEAALAAVEAAVGEAVARALVTCDQLEITPYGAALREARDYLAQTTAASSEMLDELFPAEPASATTGRSHNVSSQ
jgi:hypothetical protein